MKILCLQHVPFEGPGSVRAWARRRGHEMTRVLSSDGALPKPDSFDWLVVMGGPMMGQPGQGPMGPGQGPMMGQPGPMGPGAGQGMGPMGGMGMMADLWKLPPNRLEAVFMSLMIPHHQGAIDMANLAPERASHQELKDLAGSIVQSQTAEVGQMNGWLAAWYGL